MADVIKEVFMSNRRKGFFQGAVTPGWFVAVCCLCFVLAAPLVAQALTVNVVGCNSNNVCTTPVNGFRWILEDDNTNQSPPGVRVNNSIGLDIFNSHAPLLRNGVSAGSSAAVTVPDITKRYFISVLPNEGYTMGGVTVSPGASSVTVKVHQFPIPTAQISVFAFKDHDPINNIPDAAEPGIAGATVLVFDQFGQMSADIFGNPLGTTYNPDGSVDQIGTGVILTDQFGKAFVRNIPQGKYGIRIIPPGDASEWIQTATIEGTPGVDAWVKPNEPPFFIEGFGTGFYHVFIGFVRPKELPWAVQPPSSGATVTGVNRFNHFGRPPNNQLFVVGPPVPECWIAINDITAATNKGRIAVPCDGNSAFTINNVPAGTYQLVTWDKPLDALFGFNTVVVPPASPSVNLGNVLSFRWFGTLEGAVFFDRNRNGFRNCITAACNNRFLDDIGISMQTINIRFRDGSLYQTTVSDPTGEYKFAEVFPFFKWLVVESDYLRYKPTGMTTAIDYGGTIPTPSAPPNQWLTPSFGILNPQPQAVINPNTGNNLSRTETGPVLTQAMHLFLNQANVIDWGRTTYGATENGGVSGIVYYATTRAENDPRNAVPEPWEPGIPRVQVNLYVDADGTGVIDDINGDGAITLSDVDNYPLGNFPGPEDIDRNGNGLFDQGDAVAVTWTDSWDDNKPTGCIQDLPAIPGVQPCFDNYGTWNQVRPGVFDGGYAFGSLVGTPLAAGSYIVEAVAPPGYIVQKEEDKNVDFGDEYKAGITALPAACVGTAQNTGITHIVPPYLTLFPGQQVPSPRAGQTTPLCTMKQVTLTNGKNVPADFFFFSEVPKAGRVVGFANNDLAAEFRSYSPVFGEKASPNWIPISFQDWQGNEVNRIYSDEFGAYNAMVPSTFTMNAPIPSGVSPNMVTLVLNHPFLPDGSIDPYYSTSYSVTPWTFDYWPGKTWYADTPIVPVASFANLPYNGADVEPADGTPVIRSVVNSAGNGPVVCSAPGTITINAMGPTEVLNPDFDPNLLGSMKFVTRDYGFGTSTGTVRIGNTVLTVTGWSNLSITATVPGGTQTGQLSVTRGDNARATETGLTVHVSTNGCANVRYVNAGAGTIQSAIDAASTGDLIIVNPGVYSENPILYKAVKLQGSGEGATKIFANPSPAERLAAWHSKILSLLGNDPFVANEAPGIMVLGNVPPYQFTAAHPSLIDGFHILGAIMGGAIYVNTDVDSLTISNNRIMGNQGNFAGGIAAGAVGTGVPNNNPNLTIAYNRILKNGGIQGSGGIALYEGATGYRVSNNIIAGNFSRFNGGGIGHIGLSNNGLIQKNRILFNEVAFGGAAFGEGAGIFVGGDAVPNALTAGAGNVTINANLIQGNLAGVGNGGGISASFFNGQDVVSNPGNQANWYGLNIFNNMIVNNVAGVAGGGIVLQDVAKSNILNNTIANNDSTGTGQNAFIAGSANSTPQAAGLVSNVHSALLQSASGQLFSNPNLQNTIIYNNRSFYTTNGGNGGVIANPTGQGIWDMTVKGVTGQFSPAYCLLTRLTEPNDGKNYSGNNNITGNPSFVLTYLNDLMIATVIDEGGNAITVRYTRLKEALGNYHIQTGSAATNAGNSAAVTQFSQYLSTDYDGGPRPNPPGSNSDIGAHEIAGAVTQYTLTIQKAGTGTGSVSSSPAGIVCGATCSAPFNANQVVQLTAAPDTGSTFTGWSGAVTGTNPTVSVTMSAARTVTATFTRPSAATITITSPTSAARWRAPSIQTIRWTYTGSPGTQVKIQLLRGGVVVRDIADNISIGSNGTGSYNWSIPFSTTAGSNYQIKVISKSNSAIFGLSSMFTITR